MRATKLGVVTEDGLHAARRGSSFAYAEPTSVFASSASPADRGVLVSGRLRACCNRDGRPAGCAALQLVCTRKRLRRQRGEGAA